MRPKRQRRFLIPLLLLSLGRISLPAPTGTHAPASTLQGFNRVRTRALKASVATGVIYGAFEPQSWHAWWNGWKGRAALWTREILGTLWCSTRAQQLRAHSSLHGMIGAVFTNQRTVICQQPSQRMMRHTACARTIFHLQQRNHLMFCDNKQLLGAKVANRQGLRWHRRGR